MAFIPIAMLVVAAASAAYEGYESYEANKAQQDAIQEQSNQAQLKAQQESLQRANKIQQVLATQSNIAAASGVAAGSPSLSTIQTQSINEYSEDQRAAHLTSTLQKKYYGDASAAATGQFYQNEASIFSGSLLGALQGYQANKFYQSQSVNSTKSNTGSF